MHGKKECAKLRFEHSDNNKRYYTYDYYNRHTFGRRMFKIPISIDVTCPNRDGSKGYGGCAFCSDTGSGNGMAHLSVTEQIERERKVLASKGRVGGEIAYFQSFTNTYGDREYLKNAYYEALDAGVDGIIIATRADAIDEEIIGILEELNDETYLVIELGLQSINENTLTRMNRCESTADFERGYYMLREHSIKIGVHIIDLLPYETYEDMMSTARYVADIHPELVKIHALHILEGTPLGELYRREQFPLMTREEYIRIVCDQLEILPPDIVIERLTGDGARGRVLAPLWTTDKLKNLNGIDLEMARRDSVQGLRYTK